ncbi:hypothetical protein GOP47_0018647 [Adiantum capillus-veneris]|uniref:Epidermal patterning factor-like protein n=1 Tax=Adiantum capillus-veneris TaxID=13818 RepID=A0A9D4Z8C7_ADICA|nr:hypothetical protein GOP47_0018647 [Adiantum capillus-veneris]
MAQVAEVLKWKQATLLILAMQLVLMSSFIAAMDVNEDHEVFLIVKELPSSKWHYWLQFIRPTNVLELFTKSCGMLKNSSNVSSTSRNLLGSSPPKCVKKCGSCNPCKSVIVPIHIPASLPTDYYPVTWRCKCGGKLYMP